MVLTSGKEGFEEVNYTKEFEVTLSKLVLESGVKVDSYSDRARVYFFAEIIEDEDKEFFHELTVEGEIVQDDGECEMDIYLNYDPGLRRYTGETTLVREECSAGDYTLKLKAHGPQYETVSTVQKFEVKYEEGAEYKVIRSGEDCEEVSCGENCIQSVCEASESVSAACRVVLDKGCLASCKEKTSESAIESCIESCEIEQCGPVMSSDEEINKKLDQIYEEIKETREDVGVLQSMIQGLIDFLSNLFGWGETTTVTTAQPAVVETVG